MSHLWYRPTMTSILRESMASEKKRQEKVEKEEQKEKMSKTSQPSKSKTSVNKTYSSQYNTSGNSRLTTFDSSKNDRPRVADKSGCNLKKSENFISPRNSTVKIGSGYSLLTNFPKNYEDQRKPPPNSGSKDYFATESYNLPGAYRSNMFKDDYEQHRGQKETADYSAEPNRSYIPEAASKYTDDTNVGANFTQNFEKIDLKGEMKNEKTDKIQGDEDFPTKTEKRKKEKPMRWYDEEKDASRDKNLRFYRNELKSNQWYGYTIEEMLKWKGNYRELETNHQYIQWLFPNFDSSGVNINAQPLQPHEVVAITEDPVLKERFLRAYEMMLDFYGLKLLSRETGEVDKNKNWESRFKHLNSSIHNHLRISRILNALASFGFGHFLMPLLSFLMSEEKHLPNLQNRTMNRWLNRALDTSGYQNFDIGSDVDVESGKMENKTDEANFENARGGNETFESVSNVSYDKGGDTYATNRTESRSEFKVDTNDEKLSFERERDERESGKIPPKQSSHEEENVNRKPETTIPNERRIDYYDEKEDDLKHSEPENDLAASVCNVEVKVTETTDSREGRANDNSSAKTIDDKEKRQRESGYNRIDEGTQFIGCNAKGLQF